MKSIEDYINELSANDYINGDLYGKYNVKRGLRDVDGAGVLVGLTRVGDVHGYLTDEGEKVAIDGKLYYRGIDVETIVKRAEQEKRFCFDETVYLLLFGKLPDKTQLDEFTAQIGSRRTLPENFAEDSIMTAPSRDIMNKLARSVLTLYSYDEDPENLSPGNVLRQCLDLIARFPTIAAYAYMAKKHYYDHGSLIIHLPESTCSSAENILSLIRPDQKYSRLEAEILDLALVLHAEHGGGNNSTFTVRVVTSSGTDTFSAVSAGIQSLKGYKHGGANLKVIGMMDEIKTKVMNWENAEEVSAYLGAILRGEAGDRSGLIYGQGHAIYTVSDPRAVLLRDKAQALAEEKGCTKEFNLYRLVEELAPKAFSEFKGSDKSICSNVDFYSGFVYRMLDIPEDLYTPLFAISRVAGWCAHRLEEIISGEKIIRPAYKCVQPRLEYTELERR